MTGLALLTLTAACGRPRESVRVVVIWSGSELSRFRSVLAPFVRGGVDVGVRSAGNDLDALIANRVARTAVPDVALIQSPAMVDAHRDRLTPLPPARGIPASWADLLARDGTNYGVWFKAAHKSLVWYRRDRLGGDQAATWDQWVDLCRAMAASGHPPLALGAADGWVLTDWFENALLSVDPEVYRALVGGAPLWTHPRVREALRRVGEVWAIPGAFPGGPRRALLIQFDQAVLDVFRHGRAAMLVGADFDHPVIEQFGSAPAGWFRFPCREGEKRSLIVGGDAAVLLNRHSDAGRELIAWLATPRAADIWARAGGFLSVNPAVKDYPPDLAALADQVRAETTTGQGPAFDLSDQLGGRLTGSDGRGTWKIFQDFFAGVAIHRTPLDVAVTRTCERLAAEQEASS
ncbi:ABC transporter substrate-binding protein [Actinoallomurus spadix]|uniref:ABC transporter substrate-binding protein n=2 Tax=Actinoallomurus spadix TaxID=79912 RepID=A0ABN0WNN1_9ACTN